MAKKFGKKNVIKTSPADYNVGIIGESGVGKTTLMAEVCESLVGEDGYMILNIGREDGVDAIPNASYENIPDFETLEEFVEEVVENRNTDYKDLRIVVIDTVDELFRITEPEVVRLHNREYHDKVDKQVKSIKAAFGGYQAGEEKAIELIINNLWALKDVGIALYFVGHTKRKSVNDVATGDEYETLTSNLMAKYFNAIKTKLHFLGVASIDRTIEKQKVKQKVGKDKEVGKVVDERRVITFRDNNFNIDSKSRFSDIVEQIPLDAKEFVKAIEDAIKVAHSKQRGVTKSVEETKVEQEQQREEEVTAKVEKAQSEKVDAERNKELLSEFVSLMKEATEDQRTEVQQFATNSGYQTKDVETNPTSFYEKLISLVS